MRFSARTSLLLAALAAALPATVAVAQPYGGYYGGYYGGGYHASTAGESYARGESDMMRSQGVKNLLNSEAAINMGQARSQNLDNQIQATNTYWEKKKIYEQNTAQKRYEENQHRQKVRQRNMLTSLTSEDLDPTTGAIKWPMVLADDSFSEYRDPLAKLFEKQAQEGALAGPDYLEAKKLIKEFRMAVTADKENYPQQAVSPSLRFLLKLDRELDANLS
ncbi:hypothetical protein KOR34_21540 [Posidoniimonas corsicana]|uniref:Uncharacterized protein n=1 Tax=Posidoniimonas corsicana TaxID=1938618 RepID=A0A5C5VGX1_9BACT|nr:hypothetical protein [Posidoniimonas corsicana]TWT37207.1 hypothetical protein KOR34_21540 [Posidoniimonas corsicana]